MPLFRLPQSVRAGWCKVGKRSSPFESSRSRVSGLVSALIPRGKMSHSPRRSQPACGTRASACTPRAPSRAEPALQPRPQPCLGVGDEPRGDAATPRPPAGTARGGAVGAPMATRPEAYATLVVARRTCHPLYHTLPPSVGPPAFALCLRWQVRGYGWVRWQPAGAGASVAQPTTGGRRRWAWSAGPGTISPVSAAARGGAIRGPRLREV